MAKAPPNLPAIGDDVKLRGRKSFGRLVHLDKEMLWARVDWDPTVAAQCPTLCHLHELERVNQQLGKNDGQHD